MEALESLLQAEVDLMQYIAFFGALAVFGLLELCVSRSHSPSRRLRRWPLNYGITALNIVVLGALPVSGIVVADYARESDMGLLNYLSVDPLSALALGILLRSLISWTTHFAMHKVPFLWRVHRMHHTDTFLDVSTTVRFHPIEFLINASILVGAVFALGLSPVTLMLYELFDAAMAVFTHANIRMPRVLDRLLRTILVTPDMHRIHHSSSQPETDSNYGATLSVWDHLFRTHRTKSPEELATMELGLTECQDDRAQSFWWLMGLPFGAWRIPSIQPDAATMNMLTTEKTGTR